MMAAAPIPRSVCPRSRDGRHRFTLESSVCVACGVPLPSDDIPTRADEARAARLLREAVVMESAAAAARPRRAKRLRRRARDRREIAARLARWPVDDRGTPRELLALRDAEDAERLLDPDGPQVPEGDPCVLSFTYAAPTGDAHVTLTVDNQFAALFVYAALSESRSVRDLRWRS
jgi:hypothetical protein